MWIRPVKVSTNFFSNDSIKRVDHTPMLEASKDKEKFTSQTIKNDFELKFLLNLLDIWKKFIKKETTDLDKRKKY